MDIECHLTIYEKGYKNNNKFNIKVIFVHMGIFIILFNKIKII